MIFGKVGEDRLGKLGIRCIVLKHLGLVAAITQGVSLGGASGKKNPPANTGDIKDVGLIPGWTRAPEGEHGSPFQYSCLENPMDRGAWWATVHRVTMSLA